MTSVSELELCRHGLKKLKLRINSFKTQSPKGNRTIQVPALIRTHFCQTKFQDFSRTKLTKLIYPHEDIDEPNEQVRHKLMK